MAAKKDKEVVSFWFWFFALFIMAFPCVGIVMTFYWAFAGENQSRKNYFRAILAWCAIGVIFWMVIMALGFSPLIQEKVQAWLKHRH